MSFQMVGTLFPLRTPSEGQRVPHLLRGAAANLPPPTTICVLSGEQRAGEARTPPHRRQHEDPRPYSGAEGLSPGATSGFPWVPRCRRSGVQARTCIADKLRGETPGSKQLMGRASALHCGGDPAPGPWLLEVPGAAGLQGWGGGFQRSARGVSRQSRNLPCPEDSISASGP